MKKRIFLCLLAAVLAISLCVSQTRRQAAEERLRQLPDFYAALADQPDFVSIRIAPEGAFLHLTDGSLQPVTLPDALIALLNRPWYAADGLRMVYKQGDDVYFVTGADVDDRFGYVVTSDASVCMEGLATLERVGNGVFRFSTRK